MPNEKPDSFQCGPFEAVRNPDIKQFVEKLNKLREEVDKNRIVDGAGYTFSRSTGGTSLTIKTQSATVANSTEHPFTIRVRLMDKQHQFWIAEGMISNSEVKISNAQEWVNFKPPAAFFLEAEISDMKINKLTFKSQPFYQALDRVTIASGEQSRARISIGHYTPMTPNKEDYRIVQNVRSNLLAPIFCYQGYPALVFTQEWAQAA